MRIISAAEFKHAKANLTDRVRGGGRGSFGFKKFAPSGYQVPQFQLNKYGEFMRKRGDAKVAQAIARGAVLTQEQKLYHHAQLKKNRLAGKYTDDFIRGKNLFVTSGILLVAQLIGAVGSEAAVGFLEVGTGTTGPVIGDTLLESPILAATDATFNRQAASMTVVTVNTTRADTTFGVATAAHAVTEAGGFNASADNVIDMIARSTFLVINIAIGGSLQTIYDFPVS